MEIFTFLWALFSLFAVPYTLWQGFQWILAHVGRKSYNDEMERQGY